MEFFAADDLAEGFVPIELPGRRVVLGRRVSLGGWRDEFERCERDIEVEFIVKVLVALASPFGAKIPATESDGRQGRSLDRLRRLRSQVAAHV